MGSAGAHSGSKPTVRKAQSPSGRGKDREANAGCRKVRGNHNPPDRAHNNAQPERVLTRPIGESPAGRGKGSQPLGESWVQATQRWALQTEPRDGAIPLTGTPSTGVRWRSPSAT